MKITKRQLRRIIKEEKKRIVESYNSMSPRSKSLANAAKRQFTKDYPDVQVGIDGREGWITVNGKKAVNMSQASGSPLSMGDIIDQMKQAYLGHDMEDKYAVLPADDDPAKAYRDSTRLPGDRPGEHKLDFGKDIGTYNYRNEGTTIKITKRQLRRIIKESLLLEHPYDDAYMEVENDQFGHLEGRTKHIKPFDNGRFLKFQLTHIDRTALSPELQAKLDELLTGEWFWDQDYRSPVNLRKVPDEIKDLLADVNDPAQVQEYQKGNKAKRAKRLAAYRAQMEKDRADITAEKAEAKRTK